MLKRKVVENRMTGDTGMNQKINELVHCVPEPERESFRDNLMEIIEVMENRAFMKGYQYAIDVLKETIVKTKG